MDGPMSMTARHLANFAPKPRYSIRRSRQAVESLGDHFARREGQRLCPLVDLDARKDTRLLDDLDQRRSVLCLLAYGLVVQNDAGYTSRHGVCPPEQQLAIVPPAIGGGFDPDRKNG